MTLTPDAREQLEAYFRLLTRWNARINLTALPLEPPTDETIDRLLIEPLVAASLIGAPPNWYDVGSGGGSPAIPFKIAHPQAKLTMVESRARKAAFLREAVRTMGLPGVVVENARLEELAADPRRRNTADLVTMRAVKAEPSLWDGLASLTARSGRLFLFHSADAVLDLPAGLERLECRDLGTAGGAMLSILRPVFHVEHHR